jgi:hypothetical protein
MKKIVIILITLFLLTSCFSDKTKDLVFQNYNSKKTELNLENKNLSEFPDFSSLY